MMGQRRHVNPAIILAYGCSCGCKYENVSPPVTLDPRRREKRLLDLRGDSTCPTTVQGTWAQIRNLVRTHFRLTRQTRGPVPKTSLCSRVPVTKCLSGNVTDTGVGGEDNKECQEGRLADNTKASRVCGAL